MNASIDRRAPLRWLLILGLAGCGSNGLVDSDPPGTTRPEDELNIIELPANHPPFFETSVSFWAKVGESAKGTIYFQDDHGDRGDKFAELKLDDGSLVALGDGTPLEPGDSVLITMSVSDQSRFLVQMLPSGLKFSPQHPAELKLEYDKSDGDFDRNGKHDDDDDEIERKLSIWVQETPSDPFLKVGTVKTDGARELKASLLSFSRFAIAY
jgi:hypothetical protein